MHDVERPMLRPTGLTRSTKIIGVSHGNLYLAQLTELTAPERGSVRILTVNFPNNGNSFDPLTLC